MQIRKIKWLAALGGMSNSMKASLAFLCSSIAVKGVNYITTPILTRILSTEQYGQVSVYLTWEHIFGIVAMFCLSNGVFNNGMVDHADKRDEFSFSMLVLSNVITLMTFAAVWMLYPIISQFVKIDRALLLLMFGVFLFQPAFSFWNARQRYELKYKWNSFWTIVIIYTSQIISIICVRASVNGNLMYARLLGVEIPLIVAYMGFYLFLGIRSRWRVNTGYWKSALLFNLPLIPHYLSTYMLNSSDKIIIGYLINDSAVAYYSVAYSVAALAMVLWSSINGSLIPYTYEHCKKKDYASIAKITYPILIGFAAMCVCIGLLAPEIVGMIARPDYAEAVYVIPPIVSGIFFQVQYYLYANIVYYYKKPKYVMIGSVTAVVMNIALNFAFIPMYGYMAAGYTTLACYALQALIDYIGMKKAVHERVYHGGFILAVSFAVLVIMLGSTLLYDLTPFIRYGILGAVAIAAILCRGRIHALVKTLKK